MNFIDLLQTAMGQNSSSQQADEVRQQYGLPPMGLNQNFNQAIEGLEQAAGQEFLRGMDAVPIGPPGARLPVPAGRGALSGTVQGGPLVPQAGRPGIGRGNVYDGTIVPPQGAPGVSGAANTGQQGAKTGSDIGAALMRVFGVGGDDAAKAAGQAGRTRRTNQAGQPAPDSGPIPMGGPQGSTPRPPGQPQEPTGLLARLHGAFGNLTGAQRAGVLGTGGIASMQLPGALERIFGGDPAQSETAARLPLPDWATGSGGSGGGTGGGVNELPAAWRSQIQQTVPGIDYENLPRPDYETARGMLAELAPEAPEERNWLDKLPVNAKNIIGFGLLLGPLGLLLGAGVGASANRQIDKAAADEHKQEAREYMREMIGFDLDWAKLERDMSLQEQQGQQDEALKRIELERQFQQWAMDDASWQEDMAASQLRRAQIMRGMQPSATDTMDKLWQNALIQAPDQVMGMYSALSGADNMPLNMSAGQQEVYDQMIRANIVRALYQ